jgi:hypothetical protein
LRSGFWKMYTFGIHVTIIPPSVSCSKCYCLLQFVKENWDFGYQLLKEVPDSAIEGDKPIEDFYTDQFVPACP